MNTDLGDLALAALQLAAHDADLVVLADRQAAHVVLATQLLRQRAAHNVAPNTRRCAKVRGTALAPRRRTIYFVYVCQDTRRDEGDIDGPALNLAMGEGKR